MWKCVYCDSLQRGVSNRCPRCHRSSKDSAPFAERLEKIEQALQILSLLSYAASEINPLEKEALALLSSHNMSLLGLVSHMENKNTSVATSFAHILKNVAG